MPAYVSLPKIVGDPQRISSLSHEETRGFLGD